MKNVLITINYNDAETTCKFIDRIKDYKSLTNIIIVDNCSTDNSYNLLKKYNSEKISVIQTPKNGGYGYGNNMGIRYANEKYEIDNLIISNPDVFFSDQIINDLCSKLYLIPDLYEITGVMRHENGDVFANFASKLPRYANVMLENMPFLNYVFNSILKLGQYEKRTALQDKGILFTDVLPGSFFVIRNETMNEIGLFSEKTFLYFEESILAARIKAIGGRAAIDLNSNFVHSHSITINKRIKKWIVKEKIYRDSAIHYLEEINTLKRAIIIYKIVNTIFIPERFVFSQFVNFVRKKRKR